MSLAVTSVNVNDFLLLYGALALLQWVAKRFL